MRSRPLLLMAAASGTSESEPSETGQIRGRDKSIAAAMETVQVEFYRDDESRVTGWHAVRGQRTRIPGTVMALGRGDISHDLAQYIVEAATGTQDGFWGLLARGATFKSVGRERTRQGRALIAGHRGALRDSENLAAFHIAEWRAGKSTVVTQALRDAAGMFSGLKPGERRCFTWPQTNGRLVESGN